VSSTHFRLGDLLSVLEGASEVLPLDDASRLANAVAYALILLLNISFMAATEGIVVEDIVGAVCFPGMAIGVREGRLG